MAKLGQVREQRISEAAKSCKGIVLDIGCAVGHFTKRLVETSEFVVGLDFQRIFSKNDTSVNFVNGDALHLPFRDGAFDAVTSFDVIEHLLDGSTFLTEMHKVLKPTGVFLITTPNRDRLNIKFLGLFGVKVIYPRHMGTDPEVGDITHIHEYSKSELHTELIRHGFIVDTITGVHLGIVYGLPPKIEIGVGKVPKFLERFASVLMAVGSRSGKS